MSIPKAEGKVWGQPPRKHTASASHTSLFLCRPVCRPLPPDIARSRWPAAALLRADPPACDRPALPLADAQNTAAAVLMKSDEHVSDEPQSHRALKHRCRCRAPPPPPPKAWLDAAKTGSAESLQVTSICQPAGAPQQLHPTWRRILREEIPDPGRLSAAASTRVSLCCAQADRAPRGPSPPPPAMLAANLMEPNQRDERCR